MGVSKVVLGNDTVMDITDSTVTSENLLKNEVAYGANGNRIVGSFDADKYVDWESYNYLGAKNIIKFPYFYGSGTSSGLTITVNDDGSVTASGQPTQTIAFPLVYNLITEYELEVGDKLIISENDVENNNASAALIYVNPSGAISLVQGDYELTVTSEMVTKGVAFILWFNTGVDLTTPVTFKPMIRLDTDPDNNWAPPTLTNRKLTEWVAYLEGTKSVVQANPSGTSTGNLTAISINGVIYAVQGGGSSIQSDWDQTDTTADDYIKNKPTIPAAQVNADWNASSGVSAILNKPTIPAAVAVKGDAESSYRTGNVNLTPANIGAVATSDRGETVIKADKGASHTTAMAGYWAAMLNSSSTGSPVLPTSGKWWHVLSMDWSGSDVKNWISQLALPTQDGDNHLYHRTNTSGQSIDSKGWTKVANSADIPSVGNGTLTIQRDGSSKGTFTANQGGNTTVNIVANKVEFSIATKEFNVSVGAYSDGVYTIDMTMSGWTPLGIVGLYTGMTTLFALRYGISGNSARVDLHNVHSATVSGKASVTVLYQKTT